MTFISLLDTRGPIITFTRPLKITNNTPSFSWKSSEVASFVCSLDEGVFKLCGRGVTGTWDGQNLRDGRHVFSVRGEDDVGNLGRKFAHSWIVGKLSNRSNNPKHIILFILIFMIFNALISS